jgi:hypothetical protein
VAVFKLFESPQVHDLKNDEGSKDRADADCMMLLFPVLLMLGLVFSVLLAPDFRSEGLEKLILDLLLIVFLVLLLSTRRSVLGKLAFIVVADLRALAVTITAGLLLKSIDLIVEVVGTDLPATGGRLRATEIILVLLIEHSLATSLQALLLARGNDLLERAADSFLLIVGISDEVHIGIAQEGFFIVLCLGSSIDQSRLLLNRLRGERTVTHLHVHHGVELLVHGGKHVIEIFLALCELEIEHLVHLVHLLEHFFKIRIILTHRSEGDLELLKVTMAIAVVALTIVPAVTILMMRAVAVVAMESLIIMMRAFTVVSVPALTSLLRRVITMVVVSLSMLVVRRVHGRNFVMVSRDSFIVSKHFSDVHDLVGLVSHRTVSEHEDHESDDALAEVELDLAQAIGLGGTFGALGITKEYESENDKECSRHEHAVV